jgi:hypothetical protein
MKILLIATFKKSSRLLFNGMGTCKLLFVKHFSPEWYARWPRHALWLQAPSPLDNYMVFVTLPLIFVYW